MTFKEILNKLNNRYVYAILIFLFIILFFDPCNLFKQRHLKKALQDNQQQIEFYKEEIAKGRQFLDDLEHDTATMERVARENYMMKRDNEVIYLIDTQK